MYYILYGLFYLLSLIPWRILYLLSDFAYVVLYYIVGYRKGVVMSNLLIAFPEKTKEERVAIAKKFYSNFIDSFVETIKFFSLSDYAFTNRISGNFELIGELYKTGQNVQIHGGHFFSWEYMNWGFARNTPYPFIGVYAPIKNKNFDRLMLKMRTKYNSIMVNAYSFSTTFHTVSKGRYAVAYAADQNPPAPDRSFWIDFFGKPTSFFMGPEKSARINNTAVIFAHNYKIKRGHYHVDLYLKTTQPGTYKRGQLTADYVAFLEDCIRKTPANYLWSHRRWKREYNTGYSRNLIPRGLGNGLQ